NYVQGYPATPSNAAPPANNYAQGYPATPSNAAPPANNYVQGYPATPSNAAPPANTYAQGYPVTPSNAAPPANNYAQGYPSGYVPVAPGPVIIDSELHYGGKSSHVGSSGVNAGHRDEMTADSDGDASAS
ncbi:iron transport multicopper oxidase FET3, partial [Aspergillus lentulus]